MAGATLPFTLGEITALSSLLEWASEDASPGNSAALRAFQQQAHLVISRCMGEVVARLAGASELGRGKRAPSTSLNYHSLVCSLGRPREP